MWVVRGENDEDLGAFSTYEKAFTDMSRMFPGLTWQQTGANEYSFGTMTIKEQRTET